MPLAPDRMTVLMQTRDDWMDDREVMKNQNMDLPSVLKLLGGEVTEAIETVQGGDLGFDDQMKAVEQELADIGWFLLTAYMVLEKKMANRAIETGKQPEKSGDLMFRSMMEKHARNIGKYPAFLFDGSLTYQEATELGKWDWKQTRGNDEFYNGKPVEEYVPEERTLIEPPPLDPQFLPEGYVITPEGVRKKTDEERLEEVRSQLSQFILESSSAAD